MKAQFEPSIKRYVLSLFSLEDKMSIDEIDMIYSKFINGEKDLLSPKNEDLHASNLPKVRKLKMWFKRCEDAVSSKTIFELLDQSDSVIYQFKFDGFLNEHMQKTFCMVS